MTEETNLLLGGDEELAPNTCAQSITGVIHLGWLRVTNPDEYKNAVIRNKLKYIYNMFSEASCVNNERQRGIRAKLETKQIQYNNALYMLKMILRNHEARHKMRALTRGEAFRFTEDDIESWLTPDERDVMRQTENLLVACDALRSRLDTLVNTGDNLHDALIQCNQMFVSAMTSSHFTELSQILKNVDAKVMGDLAYKCTENVTKFLHIIQETDKAATGSNQAIASKLKELETGAARDTNMATPTTRSRVFNALLENARPAASQTITGQTQVVRRGVSSSKSRANLV